jgi:hypothetical protein
MAVSSCPFFAIHKCHWLAPGSAAISAHPGMQVSLLPFRLWRLLEEQHWMLPSSRTESDPNEPNTIGEQVLWDFA